MLLWIALCFAQTCEEPELFSVSGATSESSGVAASRLRPGVYFTHGDKGEGPALYAFDHTGELLDTHYVKNLDNEDWEDLAAAPCPDDGDCLYIGDFGDNNQDREQIQVIAVREPEAGKDTKVVQQWTAIFPEGPEDAETLLVHPCTGEIVIVTKTDGSARIYTMPLDSEGVTTLKRQVTIKIDGPVAQAREISGGDWQADGERVVLRTSDRLFVWNTSTKDPHAHWLNEPDEVYTADQVQGEAVAFTANGDLIATSEGSPMDVAIYPCSGQGPSVCSFPQTGKKCGCDQPSGSFLYLSLLLLLRRRRL